MPFGVIERELLVRTGQSDLPFRQDNETRLSERTLVPCRSNRSTKLVGSDRSKRLVGLDRSKRLLGSDRSKRLVVPKRNPVLSLRQDESFERTRGHAARSGKRESSFGTDQAGNVRTGRQTGCSEWLLVSFLSDGWKSLAAPTDQKDLPLRELNETRLSERKFVPCRSDRTTRCTARRGQRDLSVWIDRRDLSVG